MCDNRMPERLKGKIYKTVIRPVMLYGSETWTMLENDTRKAATAETRMLRWSTGKTLKDRVRNEVTLAKVKVRKIEDKLRAQRLRWFGHVERRDNDYCGKLASNVQVQGGKRKIGGQRRRWRDVIKNDMITCETSKNIAQDRDAWRKMLTRMADPS